MEKKDGQEVRMLQFGISGEFVTKIAREWLFYEGKEIEKIMELLLSCMGGTDMSEKQLKRYAEDVLLGRAEFKGNSAEEGMSLSVYGADKQPDVPDHMNIFKQLANVKKELRDTKQELEKMTMWYEVAIEHVSYLDKKEVLEETGQQQKDTKRDSLLDSFMKRWTDEEEHSTEDYGWLEPDGTFHAVPWGEHQKFASDWMKEHMTDEEWIMDSHLNDGDYLTSRGWVLMHSPSNGLAYPTKDDRRDYTKKQREWMYDYYIERHCEKEANALYQNEE